MKPAKLVVLVVAGYVVYRSLVKDAVIDAARNVADKARKLVPL